MRASWLLIAKRERENLGVIWERTEYSIHTHTCTLVYAWTVSVCVGDGTAVVELKVLIPMAPSFHIRLLLLLILLLASLLRSQCILPLSQTCSGCLPLPSLWYTSYPGAIGSSVSHGYYPAAAILIDEYMEIKWPANMTSLMEIHIWLMNEDHLKETF